MVRSSGVDMSTQDDAHFLTMVEGFVQINKGNLDMNTVYTM